MQDHPLLRSPLLCDMPVLDFAKHWHRGVGETSCASEYRGCALRSCKFGTLKHLLVVRSLLDNTDGAGRTWFGRACAKDWHCTAIRDFSAPSYMCVRTAKLSAGPRATDFRVC